MNAPPYILVEEVSLLVAAMRNNLAALLAANGLTTINYDHGTLESINQRLNSKNRTVEYRVEKFPLIWLREPYTVVDGGWGYLGSVSELAIFIIHETDKTYTEEQRKELIFKPIIIPLYTELLRLFRRSKAFSTFGVLKHQFTDYNYWGETQQQVLNDSVDCRKITNIEFKVNNNPNCTVPMYTAQNL